ncbi:MAG: hypothetical protein MUE40_05325 [Anaerolineae bacterium]|jgi:hypothetical protein|nr:hypothetical protein [Anaerolineae bacterium]
MNDIEAAILRTLLYADIFQFAITFDELHTYLIHTGPVSLAQLRATLHQSAVLQARVCISDGYITLLENGHYIAQRQQREACTRQMLPVALYYGRWLARIPFVRMVALTGALAVRNPAHAHDDFDYMLVTQPGRVWLTRACAIVLVRLARLRGIRLCPNYVLAEDHLQQQRQDLYIAHEMSQMIPLHGYRLYLALWQMNDWVQAYLPNARPAPPCDDAAPPRLQRGLEALLAGRPGAWLEAWEYRRKQARFRQQAQRPDADARIDGSSVKGHFQDHGLPIMQQYAARLRQHGLE